MLAIITCDLAISRNGKKRSIGHLWPVIWPDISRNQLPFVEMALVVSNNSPEHTVHTLIRKIENWWDTTSTIFATTEIISETNSVVDLKSVNLVAKNMWRFPHSALGTREPSDMIYSRLKTIQR